MSPRVIAIIVAIVLIIVVGMVLTVKRAASGNRAQQVWHEPHSRSSNA